MSAKTCNFVWYELMTTDTAAALDFYKAVIGWGSQKFEAKKPDEAGHDYTILTVQGSGVAGLMNIPAEACAHGAPPAWLGYIGVDDVDAYVERIQAAGGSVKRAAQDIPDVGRFAVMADPYGAVFLIMKPEGTPPENRPAPDADGMIGWHELYAGDGEGAFKFYSELFGWGKEFAMDMGEMGVYQLFSAGGAPIGGMMTKMPDCPGTYWAYYFYVEDINAGIKRITDNGGKITMGPHQVPGGNWIAQAVDPQGANFAILTRPDAPAAEQPAA